MKFSLVHVADVHFGEVADLNQIEALESLVPDLEPQVTVIAGDVSLRARHGEFQRAKALVKELERTAPVYMIPGNHDVQWWWRPFIPFGRAAKYEKYSSYFGPVLCPTLDLPEAVIAGALTSHGVAWGSLSRNPRDIAVKGHLPRKEIERVAEVFRKADTAKLRVLVVHHNVLRGELSQRMGLSRWKVAQRRIAACGADLVLCGHDHQEQIDILMDGPVVACTGTLSTRSRGGRAPVFYHITADTTSIRAAAYRWEADRKLFRRTDEYVFARNRVTGEAGVTSPVG